MGNNDNFYKEAEENSIVKIKIVSKYFWAWAKIILTKFNRPIYYIDLFCGKGKYDDGTKCTAVEVMQKIIAEKDVRFKKIRTIFNDRNKEFIDSTKRIINSLEGISTLIYPPKYYNYEVDERNFSFLKEINVPALLFLDPWGYKGISINLIQNILQTTGSECIFFFNFARICGGIDNPNGKVQEHIEKFFDQNVDVLQKYVSGLYPEESENVLLEILTKKMYEIGGKYVLTFRFKKSEKKISHHIIFVSKNFKGYEIMKEIMAKERKYNESGECFEYNCANKEQELLYRMDPRQTLEDLKKSLLTKFSAQTLTMENIYRQHNEGTPFIEKDYIKALSELAQENKIIVDSFEIAESKNEQEFLFDIKDRKLKISKQTTIIVP